MKLTIPLAVILAARFASAAAAGLRTTPGPGAGLPPANPAWQVAAGKPLLPLPELDALVRTGPGLSEEDRLNDLAQTQYAILRKLMGYTTDLGSFSDRQAYYEDLLSRRRIRVTPLDPTARKAERVLLASHLVQVRAHRENGDPRKVARARRAFLSLDDVAANHRELILRHLDSIEFDAQVEPPDQDARAYQERSAKLAAMLSALRMLHAAAIRGDSASSADALAAFNAAARPEGAVRRQAEEPWAAVFERAIAGARRLHAEAAALYDKAGGSRKAWAPPLAAGKEFDEMLAAQKAASGRFFDGNGGQPPKAGELSPGAGEKPSDALGASPAHGASKSAKPSAKPKEAGLKTGNPPKPSSTLGDGAQRKAKRKPGILGMAGNLIEGLFRTAGRLGGAVTRGVGGVFKAVFS